MSLFERVQTGRPKRVGLAAIAVAAILLALVTAGTWMALPGHPALSALAGETPGPPTPPGTGIVARLPIGADASFSWSPDGLHLLVSDTQGSRVYDRFGRKLSELPPVVGWLDAGHLVGGDGKVEDITRSSPGTSPAGSEVFANGHGAAAIVTARPACGDATVDWYRDGHYVRSQEQGTPFGWSPDGKLLLMGHGSCDSPTGGQGWQGTVQAIDFATGKVVASLPAVRGQISFETGGDSLAAQSDSTLEVVELPAGDVETFANTRFLGWLDTETSFVATDSGVQVMDLDPPQLQAGSYAEWQAESPNALHVSADMTGAARAILAQDGSRLMDLSGLGLVLERPPATGQPTVTGMQPSWWSPDGRMLALESADGSSLALLSVDSARRG